MSRYDKTIKWNIAFDVIFEKVEAGQLTMHHPTFHDMASPLLHLNEIDEKNYKSIYKT